MSAPARLVGILAAAGVAAAIVGACSDDSHPVVCGDGRVDPPEQCDDGNTDEFDGCRMCVAYIAPKNVIKWDFNAAAAPGFTSDGCADVAATSVRVALSGPASQTKDGTCSLRQVSFEALPAGTYTAAVTPLDSAGMPLVTTPATATLEANLVPSTTVETVVNVEPTLWARPMTGTFYFVLRWGGLECAMAAPPVTTQVVTMTIGGSPVTASTSSNTGYPSYRVDGTQPVTCITASTSSAEAIDGLAFGPIQIAVVGRDAGGAEMFRGAFSSFVGAGRSNPVLIFDVPSTIDAGVDAGVDAPIDAPPDA
ncbi:MAG: DUF4215 domain-containing protein [Kofleriaceae bacterium]